MDDGIKDIGKRIYDTYNLHRLADSDGNIGKWFAVTLADGTSDGHVYPSKSECMKAQHHNEQFYAFIQIGPWQMPAKEAEDYIKLHRKMYDAGMRITDPTEGGKEYIRRISRRDEMARIRALFRGTPQSNITFGAN